MKYLLPWEMHGTYCGKPTYVRRFVDGSYCFCIYHLSPYNWASYGPVAIVKGFNTAQEAMDALDVKLLSKGYGFITLERAEKLSLLL